MALDSSYGLEVPSQTQPPAADKPLQDPVEAMKQLVDAGNKTLTQSSAPDVQSGRSPSTSKPDYLDMGDAGSLYKSQSVKTDADVAAKAPTAESGAKTDTTHTAEVSAKTAVADASQTRDAGATSQAVAEYGSLKGDASGKVLPESQHTVAKGETLEGIARQSLGPQASTKEVQRYANVMAAINGLEDPTKMKAGSKINLPSHNKDGSIQFTSPDNKDEHFTVHKDGSFDVKNKADGTSYDHINVGTNGNYSEQHKGPKPEDNYVADYDAATHVTTQTRFDAAGNAVITDSTGYKKTTDAEGVIHETLAGSDQTKTVDSNTFPDTAVRHNRDGSTVTAFGDDGHTEAKDADGTLTTKWADGKVVVQKTDNQGHETGYVHEPVAGGGYKEHGWGPTAKDNYDETYDPKTGATTRQEGKGTPAEKTTTSWADGTVKVEAKDGKNYQRSADGAEHHWGKENYDKPAYDYANDQHLNKAKAELNQAVGDHVPADKQANFKKDMTDFEARAKREHLSPEEVAKTYEQMSKMINAPDGKAVVSSGNRAILAEGLIHQAAHPGATKQGIDNTCNVTTVAENTLTKNPSKMAAMATEAALTGQWTAPDGKVIKLDKGSLTPGAQESEFHHDQPEIRTYATQIANLVVANDALQRRVPPESYVQRNPSFPGDTGERRLDATGKEISYQQYDATHNTWISRPDNSPGVTNHEIAAEGKRLNGKDYHLLSTDDSQGGVDNIRSADELQARLLQLKQQGQLPVTMVVDGNMPPIAQTVSAGYGSHVVTIDSYNEVTKKAHITNQWNPADDKEVDVTALYRNARGS